MHEDNKAKGRSMLHASRRRFVQGLAAVGTFAFAVVSDIRKQVTHPLKQLALGVVIATTGAYAVSRCSTGRSF